MGLRERQKEYRQNLIVSVAKNLFKKQGFDRTTIEAIAQAAGVSGVTVHNYYGTKSGVLLALVVENDAKLIAVLERAFAEKSSDLIDLTCRFARIVMDHALENLDKSIWRQVIAAVSLDAGSPFGKAYLKLDTQLAYVLVRQIEAMQNAGHVPRHVDAVHLGKALFQLQNARFIEFISSASLTCAQTEHSIRTDLSALFFCQPPQNNPSNLAALATQK